MGRDHRSGGTLCQEDPFTSEYRIGRVRSAAGDPKLAGETARRRQPAAGRQRTGKNGRAQPGDDLPVQWAGRAAVEGDRQGRHGPVSLSFIGPRL